MKRIGIRLFLLACLLPVSMLLERPAPNEAAFQEGSHVSSVLEEEGETRYSPLDPQVAVPGRFDRETAPEKITEISIGPISAEPEKNVPEIKQTPGERAIPLPKDPVDDRVLKLVKSKGIAAEKASPII